MKRLSEIRNDDKERDVINHFFLVNLVATLFAIIVRLHLTAN